MASLRRSLLLVLAAALAALSLATLSVGSAQAAESAPATERQILVFLRVPPQHFRPNTDYGGSYGDSEGRSARMRIAGRLARQYGVSIVSEWPMPMLGVDCFVMEVAEGQSPAEAAARLSQDPGVSWSQPVQLYMGQAAPAGYNDPLYRVQPVAADWRLASLHRISTGRRVRVAVIDSMVERNHPDLAGQVDAAENFVTGRATTAELHGTGVAGIIAARADNGMGIAGVAPGARLLALRACWQEAARTVCDSLSLARALTFAISQRAQVINMSLSGPPDLLLGKLLDIALARGVTVVSAYDRAMRDGGFPASHPGVIAVAEKGPAITGVYSAPGRDIPTTQPGGGWALVDGSSYAAAHVSGLFALLRGRTPPVNNSWTPVLAHSGDTIDACATLLQRPGPCDCCSPSSHEFVAAFPE
jgi:subtilisin family serine protease